MTRERRSTASEIAGQADQRIRVLAHSANDHNHLIAVLMGADGLSCCRHDLFGIGNTSAAKLLND